MATHTTSLIGRLTGVFAGKQSHRISAINNKSSHKTSKIDVSNRRVLQASPKQDEWLVQLRRFVETHISNSKLNASWLAKQYGMSRRHFQRLVKAAASETPHEFISRIKMELAMNLLESGKVSTIGEASRNVGFVKTAYFSRLFKTHYGISPSDILKKGRRTPSSDYDNNSEKRYSL